MKKIISIIYLLIAFTCVASAQQQKQPVLKPIFVVEDLVFVYQTLDNVEITGSEVEAFLDVKRFLQGALQLSQQNKKQPTETLQVEAQIPTAQNMLGFLNRAKLSGRMAEQYKRFVDALMESSKKLQTESNK